mmetsp:Transcript_4704/g.6900  ORF Transcript_4704/g.6900 Transcript_4704/m.6900 type:complete len:125 (+) Transcript_4704:459-833(+)
MGFLHCYGTHSNFIMKKSVNANVLHGPNMISSSKSLVILQHFNPLAVVINQFTKLWLQLIHTDRAVLWENSNRRRQSKPKTEHQERGINCQSHSWPSLHQRRLGFNNRCYEGRKAKCRKGQYNA